MMKTKPAKVLPQTVGEISNGGIYAQSRRCGKKTCRCVRGEKHRGYFFFTRRDGKLTKTYIRKSKLAEFSRLVNLATAERKARRQTVKDSTELLKKLRVSLVNNDGLINSLKGTKNYAENRI